MGVSTFCFSDQCHFNHVDFRKRFLEYSQGGISLVNQLCYLCLVFHMRSCLFIAALWSPEGKELTSWLLFVMFIVILLLSHLVSWDRCVT